MAKLILTAKERQAASYLEWSDAALGRAVKCLALGIEHNKSGEKALIQTACATMLACMAAQCHSVRTVIRLNGVTEGQTDYGDWTIVVQNGQID